MANQTMDVFQVLSDPSRRQILYMLSQDSMAINSLAENFDMSRPAVSKHIKILDSAGFITIENIGRERFCSLKQDGFNELKTWIEYFDSFWLDKLKTVGSLMENRQRAIK